MKIEIRKDGERKTIRFVGKVNMSQEISLSSEDVKRFIEKLNSENDEELDTE